jgi:hypothetical protein
MKVKAATGLRVPKESKPRQYITDAESVEVPGSAYYLRSVAIGDLVRTDVATETAATTPKSQKAATAATQAPE